MPDALEGPYSCGQASRSRLYATSRGAGRWLTDRQPFEPGEDEGDAGELAVTGAVRVIRQTDIKGMPYIEYRVAGAAGLWSGSGERKVPGRQLANSGPSIFFAPILMECWKCLVYNVSIFG